MSDLTDFKRIEYEPLVRRSAALDAENGRLRAKVVEQADRIAWLEGEVAGWRIKLAECEESRSANHEQRGSAATICPTCERPWSEHTKGLPGFVPICPPKPDRTPSATTVHP